MRAFGWAVLAIVCVLSPLVLAFLLGAARRNTLADIADGIRVGARALNNDPNPTATPADVLRDAGPPHNGLLCLVHDGSTWLCRYPLGDGHPVHTPYVEGEYQR